MKINKKDKTIKISMKENGQLCELNQCVRSGIQSIFGCFRYQNKIIKKGINLQQQNEIECKNI